MRWGVRSPPPKSQTMDSHCDTTASAGVALSAAPANRGVQGFPPTLPSRTAWSELLGWPATSSVTRALRRRRGARHRRTRGRSAVPRKPSSPAGATAITIQYRTCERRALRDRAADHRWPADGRSRASCARVSLWVRVSRPHVSVVLVWERVRACVCDCRREFAEWTCRVASSRAPKFQPTPFVINLTVFFFFVFFFIRPSPRPIRSDLFIRFRGTGLPGGARATPSSL